MGFRVEVGTPEIPEGVGMLELTRGHLSHGRLQNPVVKLGRGEERQAWRRAPCPQVLHPKRGKAKDLVMCCTKRERLGGLVHLPGIDRKTPALHGHVANVVIKLTRQGVVVPYA
eukprot:1194334-Prorocentrum_minimum.AAC.2